MNPASALHPQHSILGRLFGRRADGAPGTGRRLVVGSPAAECAAEMLSAPMAMGQLSLREARSVVGYMQPRRIPEGARFIREGDDEDTGFMALVLGGEVAIETAAANRTSSITASIVGPGSILGEMGLIDAAPRSASCIALTPLRCAILTREALNELLDDEPRTAAKLMLAISQRIAKRLRDHQEKIKLYAQLTQAMNEEINELMPH